MVHPCHDAAVLLKALAIIGVVWIHSFSLNHAVINAQFLADVFRFCVPAFIILWAYFFESGLESRNPKEYNKYIGKRFLRLLIPYVFWSCVHFLLFYDAAMISWKTLINGHFGGYGWAGQFFLIILFQWTLIFPFIRQYVTHKTTLYVMLISLLFYGMVAYELWQLPLVKKIGHRFFIYWFPYVFLGVLLAKKGVPSFNKWTVCLFIISVLLIPLESQVFRVAELRFSPYILPSVLIASVLLSMAIMSLTKSLHLPAFIRLIGHNTFAIFLLNPIVIRLLTPWFISWKAQPYMPVISDIGATIVVILLCLLLATLLRRLHLSVIVGQN